jgi:uncharacterized RDD family membrane protein YckC
VTLTLDRSPVAAPSPLAPSTRLTMRNDAVHFIIVIAIVVLLAIAVTITAAAIILCANAGGVLSTVISLDPWTVKIDCVRI